MESAQMRHCQTALPPVRYGLAEARAIIEARTLKRYPVSLGAGPAASTRNAQKAKSIEVQ
jgi:hypothetical protein